jgi:acyl transferase domain-containing protein
MLALGKSAEEALRFIEEEACRDQVVVGCHNSPSSVTLSGDRAAIEKLKEAADSKEVFARVLKTGGRAYHSHHMTEAASKYLECLQNESITGEAVLAKIPMFSTVQAKPIEETPDSYWVSNLNSPVLFNQGVQCMLKEMPEINLLIEVGPHAALNGPLRQICRDIGKPSMNYLPTLKRGANDSDQILQLVGNLWVQDAKFDIETVLGVEKLEKDGRITVSKGSLLVDLPKYPWTYSKPNLAEARASKEHRGMKEPRHDILGRRILGGSPLEPVWRNVLRQRDLPWLTQHKLAGEVMLPAAAYLALAIEAIEQINSHSQVPLDIHSYTMRDVVISTATVVPDDDEGTETLFRLCPVDGKLDISQDGKTSQWYEFSASCCVYGAWKEAATGLVGLNAKGRAVEHKPHILPATPNRDNHLDWLDKERELGVDLGPAFHHISDVYTDGKSHIVRGDMKISRECGLMEAESRYVLHPTVIDSCLQPFVEMLHKGHLDEMRCGIIPTHFGEVTIFPPTSEHMANKCLVQLWTDELGQRSYSSNVQLVGHDGTLLVDMADSRCLLYRAALPQHMQGNLQRDLYMQQTWDVDLDYISWAKEANYFSNKSLRVFVNTLLHKDATTQILCVDHNLIPTVLAELPAIRMTVAVSSEKDGELIASAYAMNENLKFVGRETIFLDSQKTEGKYSLVLGSDLAEEELQQVHKLMPVGGHLLLQLIRHDSSHYKSILNSTNFAGVEQILADNIILTQALSRDPPTNGYHAPNNEITLVYRDSPTSLHVIVSNKLEQEGWKVVIQALGSVSEASDRPAILLADTESALLAQLEEQDLKGLITLTENAHAMVWVTSGGLLTADKPEYGLTAGAARTICNEKGSLDLVTVDFNPKNTTENRVADLLIDIVYRQRKHGRNGETEYCMQNDIVYIGRLVPSKSLNTRFVPDSGETTKVQMHDGLMLTAETKNGAIVYRQAAEDKPKELKADEVEIQVAALGLSAADGADDSAFLSHELVGTVIRIGSDVTNVAPGVHVAGFALEQLSTIQRASCRLVQPIPENCSLTEAASLPSAFVTAMYGLEELARVIPGENVVIFDGMGAVGQAAVQLCGFLRANAIVVTSSPATEAYFSDYASTSDSVILLKWDNSLSQSLKASTAGRGANVVLYPATADRAAIIECGRVLAPFGRIVSVGHTNDYRSISTDIPIGSLGLSFFQFDLPTVIKHRPQIVAT